ncbi:MAG: ABC transporter permease [Pseudomonadota bacterium]|nr:ABC transporter permease [Pseudomonadota bacterium]
MLSKLRAIARYTLLEYLRGRLVAGGVAVMLAALALEQLLDGVAITEAHATQATLGGALVRPAMALLLASAIIVSHVREAGDRTRDWMLACALPRPCWLAGRLLGHAAAALLLVPLLLLSVLAAGGLDAAVRWSSGCALELLLCACMASFLSLTLRQAPLALLAFAAWYLLARSLASLQLIAAAPLLADGGTWIAFVRHALDALGVLMPRLDLFAPAGWLEGSGSWADLFQPLLQTAAYVTVLVTASVVDLQRSQW